MSLTPETQEEAWLTLRDLPSRRGGRPKMKRGVCHLQCSDHGGDTWTDQLVEGVSSWPHVERRITIAGNLRAVSFCVTEKAATSNSVAFISPQEFARCLRGGNPALWRRVKPPFTSHLAARPGAREEPV
jgi:hypothetical protein